MKKCARCKETKEFIEFRNDRRSRSGKGSWCIPCIKIYKKSERQMSLSRKAKKIHRDDNHKQYRIVERTRELQRKFNLSTEDYENMRIAQNYKCAICGKHQDDLLKLLCVDHYHKTRKVRELLCNTCNVGLGHFLDSEKLLKTALDYLIRHRN